MIGEVPVTGSNKVVKAGLRRQAWVTADPVYWREGTAPGYRLLDAAQRQALAAEFAAHGRTALYPG